MAKTPQERDIEFLKDLINKGNILLREIELPDFSAASVEEATIGLLDSIDMIRLRFDPEVMPKTVKKRSKL